MNQHSVKLIDFLSYHLKMKMIDFLFEIFMYQISNKRLFCVNWWKKVFWHSQKNKEEGYEETVKMRIKQLAIYWIKSTFQSLETNCNRFSQTNWIRKLERDEGPTMLFVIENQKKQLLNLHKILQLLIVFWAYIKWKLKRF